MEAAENLSIYIPEDFEERGFGYEKDIVLFDLVLVMDKYTAADVPRQVSVYDTALKERQFSGKVRRLADFHPQMKHSEDPDGQDIDAPLYGNYGGDVARVSLPFIFHRTSEPREQSAVEECAGVIEVACQGVLRYLQQIEERTDGNLEHFKQDIASRECIDWLVPPMLQPRQQT